MCVSAVRSSLECTPSEAPETLLQAKALPRSTKYSSYRRRGLLPARFCCIIREDMAEEWPKRRLSPLRVPHPRSSAGRHFDWSSLGAPHPDSPAGRRFDWSSLGLPHPNSPAAWHHEWGNMGLDVGLLMPSSGRPILLRIVNHYLRLGPPFSAAL